MDPNKKSNYKIKNDKNFLEENVKKLKEVKKNIDTKPIIDPNSSKKDKKLNLEDVLDSDRKPLYQSKVEKLNPNEKVERLIMATRENTEKIKESITGVSYNKLKKKNYEVSNNELAKSLMNSNNKRSTTPTPFDKRNNDINNNYNIKRKVSNDNINENRYKVDDEDDEDDE